MAVLGVGKTGSGRGRSGEYTCMGRQISMDCRRHEGGQCGLCSVFCFVYVLASRVCVSVMCAETRACVVCKDVAKLGLHSLPRKRPLLIPWQ